MEAADKLQRSIDEDKILTRDVRVPGQNNSSDCGCYVLHYVERLMDGNDINKTLNALIVSFSLLFFFSFRTKVTKDVNQAES